MKMSGKDLKKGFSGKYKQGLKVEITLISSRNCLKMQSS